jgi:hypothetical protein
MQKVQYDANQKEPEESRAVLEWAQGDLLRHITEGTTSVHCWKSLVRNELVF